MKHSMRPIVSRIAVVAILGVSSVWVLSVARRPDATMTSVSPIRVASAVMAGEPPSQRKAFVHLASSGRFGYRDGVYTGPAVDAYYGWVKVQAVVRNGGLVAVHVLRYPSDRSTSRRIARYALPRLEREVIQAQSARVDAISGATLTSEAFLQSVQGALRRAAG